MRYLCVHGHFYQPPRENPSLEAIELQDSAYPYHDWNERIAAECYAPNGWSRLLDPDQLIEEIVNNYDRISFNFGPTLLSWLQTCTPTVYARILEGDKASQGKFGGHGSAIAQGYNHMILPLANRRDKTTQVKWGIADFEARFGRKPEGMWLPETAMNTETLEVLAEEGIKFTILAPRQAKRVRRRGGRKWVDVTGDRIDPSRAYQVNLPSKKTINVFFYDGPISQGVAFEKLLDDGQRFADRLMSGFSEERDWPQLSHIATDGESYGHHHHYGEMALSYALHVIEKDKLAEVTNYGYFLERFPPDHLVEIVDDTSWSCVHGIERWRSNCGCNSGGHGDWNQEWRAPLRAALDWLRDSLAPVFEEQGKKLLKDPWAARDAYIRVILNRSNETISGFLSEHANHELNEGEKVTLLKLMEMQRHAMLMYTSCGWFFDEISGIETVQVIHYAARAIRLAEEATGVSLEEEFKNRLREAKSNLPEHGDGAQIYEKWVKPAYVNMEKMAGHYAVSSLFENYEQRTQIYCYRVNREEFSTEAEGKMRLATGTAQFCSEITFEAGRYSFAVLHLGEHSLVGGVRPADAARDKALRDRLVDLFARADATEIIGVLNEEFGKKLFSLKSLFRDEQRKIISQILRDSLTSAAAAYRSIYETQAPLIRFLNDLAMPVPKALSAAANTALNNQMRDAIDRPDPDLHLVQGFFREAEGLHVELDNVTLEFAMRRRLENEAKFFAEHPEDAESVHRLRTLLEFAVALPFQIVLWEVQNRAYAPLIQQLEKHRNEAEPSDPGLHRVLNDLTYLRENLKIRFV